MKHNRIALIVTIMALALAIQVSSAFAWENGGDEGNGYGTHDWMLDNGIRIAGDQGAWIDRETALLASDDADKEKSKVNHLYRDSYGSRGAAQGVADRYALAVEAYRAGDIKTASYHVGYLSHYYADICQPFHTEFDALHEGTLHQFYEEGIGDLTRSPGAKPSWTPAGEVKLLSDVRKKTVNAATYSRRRYPDLIRALKAKKSVSTDTVQRVTREVMTRGVNDLADIVASVPSGSGLARAPYKIKTWMYRPYPARYGKAAVYARCLNESGKPISGVRVALSYKTRDGQTVSFTEYTNKDGLAYKWYNTGDVPLMQKTTVAAFNRTGSDSNTGATWFMATPTLADGSDGIKTTLSDRTPKWGSRVTATTKIRDKNGDPVAGLPVTFSWKFSTKTITIRTVTNSSGVAKTSRDLGKPSTSYRVYVRAQTQSGGRNRSSTSSFVPHK